MSGKGDFRAVNERDRGREQKPLPREQVYYTIEKSEQNNMMPFEDLIKFCENAGNISNYLRSRPSSTKYS